VIGERKAAHSGKARLPKNPRLSAKDDGVDARRLLLDGKTRRAAASGAPTPLIQSNLDDL